MSEYKIEKGVPFPDRPAKAGKKIGRTPKYPFADMEIGDSFPLSCDEVANISAASRADGERYARKYTTRKMPDGTARCWRIA